MLMIFSMKNIFHVNNYTLNKLAFDHANNINRPCIAKLLIVVRIFGAL